MGRFSIMS